MYSCAYLPHEDGGDQTQALLLAQQALYLLSQIPDIF